MKNDPNADSTRPRVGRWERLWRASSPLLLPLSWPYGVAALSRRFWWRSRSRSLACPVVSVGNITCGGTGKTPTVEMVVGDLIELGWRPAILSRGYKASSVDGEAFRGNDEYQVLAANLPDVPHYQGADRWENGRLALNADRNVMVLDDGFQHVRLRRDLDFVLLDALDPFGRGRLLPAGLLREPIGALRHAQLIGITRVDLLDAEKLDELSSCLRKRFPETPQVRMRARPLGWVTLDGALRPHEELRGEPVLGFCGIGNPEAFRQQLLLLGVELRGWLRYADHQAYSRGDLTGISEKARKLGVAAVVMTQKDAVKLQVLEHRALTAEPPWFYLKIAQTISSGEGPYRRALERLGKGGEE